MTMNVDMLPRIKIEMYKRLETWLDLPATGAVSILEIAVTTTVSIVEAPGGLRHPTCI